MAQGMAVGVFQTLPVETRPGENHVFSPPAGFQGDEAQYRKIMRARWEHHLGASQQIAITAQGLAGNANPKEQVTGPYAQPAYQILRYLQREALAHGKSCGE